MGSMIFNEAVAYTVRSRPHVAQALLEDLKSIVDGNGPNERDLEDAPVLDRWLVVITGKLIRLSGMVQGHPKLSDGLILTSTLCAVDPVTFVWARTGTRYYRLTRNIGGRKISTGPS